VLQDHNPITINKFLGLYGIDAFDDAVPLGFFIDELNTITYGDSVKTRDGFGVDLVTNPIIQYAVYRRQGEAARTLALFEAGDLWDLTVNVKILDIPAMLGFAINYSNNRALISPHNKISGLPGEFVYTYDGEGIARKAGGLAPTAGFNIATNTSGYIEAGTHIFAVVFETESGFVTAPSPATIILFDGTKAADLSNIPIGPSGTVARRIIASRAIQSYNGNEEGYEMFFVSGGRINNNIDTSLTVNFYDADLQFSADFSYDQLDSIPAVIFIVPYGNRMAYGGPAQDKNLVYVSNPLEPESIHSSAGFISFDPFETGGVKDATEFRDNLYVVKRNKTYTVRDNTYEPSTWKPVTLDSSIGGDINSIARFYDTTGSRVVFWIISSPSGMFKFSGIYEDLAVSRNIKNIWSRINKVYMHLCQTIIDQDSMLIYMLCAVDGSTQTNAIVVGNFENGFTFDKIRWHIWGFLGFFPSSIGVDRDQDTAETVFKVASRTGNLYKQEVSRRDDDLIRIPAYIQFSLTAAEDSTITHCGAVALRIKGVGSLLMSLWGQDDVDNQTLAPVNLTSCRPGKEFVRLAHFQSERVSLKIEVANYGEWFIINKINLFLNTIFVTRPSV
jgi:hypothetical protein